MVITPQDGGLTLRVATAPFNDRFVQHWGASLTPQTLTAVLNIADSGWLWSLADILDECRERDAHLHSVLSKREQQVAGSEWELRPVEGAGAKGDTIAQWCTQRLKDLEARGDLSRSFPDAVADLQGAVYQGRAALEAVWTNEGRYWFPTSLEFIHPRRLAYATDWRLHLWDASGTSPTSLTPMAVPNTPFGVFPGLPLDAFPAGKFIVHRPRLRGSYPTREGLGRTLLWYALFKRFAIRDWLAFAEWAGRGLRIGKYANGGDPQNPVRAAPEDVAALQAALDAVSSSVSTVIPDTTQVDIHGSPKNNDVHEQLVKLCNTEQSKAVLGETLSTEVGDTGGNRALGAVHNDVRLMIARADARSLAATLRRDLLRPMVQRSFGPAAPVPELVFAVDPGDDLDALADRISKVVAMGVSLGQRDVRNLLALPDPQPDDELVGGPKEPDGDELPGAGQATGKPGDEPAQAET